MYFKLNAPSSTSKSDSNTPFVIKNYKMEVGYFNNKTLYI